MPARARRAAIPARGAVRMRSRPRRAMARFSPRMGAMSETVPMTADSASVRANSGPPGSSASSRRATTNATPLPDSRSSGKRLSARCGLTTATAAGRTGGRRWWSVTRVSMPRAAAASISGPLVEPQSTVTITLRPSSAAVSTARRESPWPSSSRLGTYGSTRRPRKRRARVIVARPLSPSASKSPKTRIPSPSRRARAMRSRSRSASGSAAGSLRAVAGGAKKARRAAPSATPRRARTSAVRREMPSRAASSTTSGASSVGDGKIQRKCGSSIEVILAGRPSRRLSADAGVGRSLEAPRPSPSAAGH